MAGPRTHFLWRAAMLHRVSGLLLAVFLPVHFLVLGLAIEGEGALNGALAWTDNVPVKIAEFGLVFLLAVHLAGGLRILVLENLQWRDGQKTFAAAAIGVSLIVAMLFGLRVL